MNRAATHPFFTIKRIQRIYGTSFSHGNKVTLLWKDPQVFHEIFDALRQAEKLICLQFYIFRNDETGTELAGILKEKAAEGCKVYMLYDHFGSFGTPFKFWKKLRQSGVEIGASRPFKWLSPFHYVHRDHRKLIIIDGVKAFTGGLNIANEYRGYHRFKKKKAWRDTGIFLEGPVVHSLFETFRKSWLVWKRFPLAFEKEGSPVPHGIPVLPIFASSARGRRRMRKLLYYSINHAEKSIFLTTAYFTPSRRLLHILAEAVRRGVAVRLLLPGKSDILAAHYAGRAFYTRMLREGIEIYNYNGEILHAKTAVFDGIWSIIGSANLDFQSLRRNDEGNVGIISREFGLQMESLFSEDISRSDKITLENWQQRPFFEKLKERFFVLFRRRL